MTIRDELFALLGDHDLPYFITFNFGYAALPASGEREAKHLFNQLQDRAYGGRWAKRRGADRITAVGFWERLDSNAHLHCAVYIPDAVAPYLHEYGPEFWHKSVPRGQCDIRISDDREAVAGYITKKVWQANDLDRMFVYSPPGGSGVHRDDGGAGPMGRTPRQPPNRIPFHVQWRS